MSTDAENVATENIKAEAGTSTARGPRRRSQQLTDWQRFFLGRLEYLLERQTELAAEADATDEQRKLLSKAIYSTFLDCQSEGLTEQALQRLAAQSSRTPSSN